VLGKEASGTGAATYVDSSVERLPVADRRAAESGDAVQAHPALAAVK
jgi:hypothetical protein